MPSFLTPNELAILDAPTADSAAVLVSLGGPLPDDETEPDEVVEINSAGDVEAGMGKEGLRRRGTGRSTSEREREREREGEKMEVKDGGQREMGIHR